MLIHKITTTNKPVNEAANDSAQISGQDRKKLPALGTNQIERFGGFRPVASLEKNNSLYCQKIKVHIFCYILVAYTLNKTIRTLKINVVKLQMDDKILRRNYLILCLKTDLSIYIRCEKSFGINLGEVTLFFFFAQIIYLFSFVGGKNERSGWLVCRGNSF